MTQVTIEIDGGAIPDGWEPQRFGFPKELETIVSSMNGKIVIYVAQPQEIFLQPRMIIRKKYDPGIRLPSGWWVWRTDDNWIASKGVDTWGDAVCGLQFLPGFIPPEDGQPRQIM